MKEFTSDLVAPKFTLMSLAKVPLYCPCPSGPKDGHNLFVEGGYWGGDNRVLSPSINHKITGWPLIFILAVSSWGPRVESLVPLSLSLFLQGL